MPRKSVPHRCQPGAGRAGRGELSAGLFQGFTIDASLSQTATAEQAGGRTQLSSLVSAALIVLTLVFLAGLFKNLPNAVLAVVVMNSVLSLMDFKELRRYYALRRTDFVVAVAALLGVVLTDVLTGLVIAVVLSLIFIVLRASRPHIALLGRAPDNTVEFGESLRHPEYEHDPRADMVRLEARLYFLNAGVAQTMIREIAATQPAAARVADRSGRQRRPGHPHHGFDRRCGCQAAPPGRDAHVRPDARRRPQWSGAGAAHRDVIGPENIFPSLAAGVEAYRLR